MKNNDNLIHEFTRLYNLVFGENKIADGKKEGRD